MPTLVQNQDGPLDRLSVAASHIESAISQINNVIQGQALVCDRDDAALNKLRLLVTALADIRAALVRNSSENAM